MTIENIEPLDARGAAASPYKKVTGSLTVNVCLSAAKDFPLFKNLKLKMEVRVPLSPFFL